MKTGFEKIFIAVDKTRYSEMAVHAGFVLAQNLGARVGLIYVVDVSKEVVSADLGITLVQIRSILRDEAEGTIKELIEKYNVSSQTETFIPEGIPEKEIIKASIDWNADVIVMGTHGRSAIGKILTGSVAEYVIRHAVVPVYIIPPRMK